MTTITTTYDALLRLCNPSPTLITNDVIRHAAHYMYGTGGHDLARWVVRHPTQPTYEQLAAVGVPETAKYHCGYVHLGAQHWVYTERRPMSPGYCERCGAEESRRLFASRGLS